MFFASYTKSNKRLQMSYKSTYNSSQMSHKSAYKSFSSILKLCLLMFFLGLCSTKLGAASQIFLIISRNFSIVPKDFRLFFKVT